MEPQATGYATASAARAAIAADAGSPITMTARLRCAKTASVSRILRLFLILIASSLVMTATIHAREIPGPATIECSGAVHSEGDADQSQGDADKAIPHHHGTCHGSSLDMPASGALTSTTHTDGLRPFPASTTAFLSRPIDPALRPPAA